MWNPTDADSLEKRRGLLIKRGYLCNFRTGQTIEQIPMGQTRHGQSPELKGSQKGWCRQQCEQSVLKQKPSTLFISRLFARVRGSPLVKSDESREALF